MKIKKTLQLKPDKVREILRAHCAKAFSDKPSNIRVDFEIGEDPGYRDFMGRDSPGPSVLTGAILTIEIEEDSDI